MKNVNVIQNAITHLEGGAFQKLFDQYLYKKYKFKNIQTLGVQTGTNKPTKGTPDSYVLTDDGKYILINYGSVSSQPADKIRDDILSCFDKSKLSLSKEKIKKIICGHCSTNIHIEQFDSIREAIEGVEIELIGVDTISHDLALIYPHIAKDELGIPIDTNQFFEVEDFAKAYDANGINAPLDCEFLHRESEIRELCNSIHNNKVTILTGASGIGKTRLALEVCRRQDEKVVKTYCVKSNGRLLYEDIKYYVSDPGKYFLFFDDANMVASLDNVLNTILTLSEEYEVNLLITVRDYAKDRIINAVSKYANPSIIEIESFKDDEIKDILKENLGIVNADYLEKITDIANGNIRLAFLAGIRAMSDGYQAICNAEDIFKNYYSRIIDDTELTKEDILMLFFIAVAGPVKSDENQLYNDLMKEYGDGIAEDNTIERLYSLELIDWFKNEITKVSDQSLGNYILYYVLFEKKWISVENLIALGFPRYRNKIVYVLNTLIEIFDSSELVKYVEDSVIAAWNNAPAGQGMEYLESFCQVNPDKALFLLKKRIECGNAVKFDLRSFDIDSKKNYHNISTTEIKILGGYKYTACFEDAVELLLLYFKKRPDLIMDFYFVLCDRFLYDKNSYIDKYSHEFCLLDKLWRNAEEGRNYNSSILYLHIAEYALKTEISFTEEVRNSRSVNFVSMPLSFTEEIASIRANIWKNLAALRQDEEYRNLVNGILSEVHFNRLREEDARKYLQSDFDAIYKYVINSDMPDFFDAKTVARYKEVAKQIGVTTDERFLIPERNTDYRIYRILTREHVIGRTLEDDEKIRRELISKETNAYELSDYRRLFISCCFLETVVDDSDPWVLSSGLDCVFEVIEDDSAFYLEVLAAYFEVNTPFGLNGYRQVKYLFNHIGYEATYDFVNSKDFDKKDIWMSLIWECLSDEDISEKAVNEYKNFVLNSFAKDKPIIPTVQVMNRYGERDSEFKEKVIKVIVDRPKFANEFLGYAYRDNDIEVILHFFKNNIDALANIYLSAIANGNHVDYDGKLFVKIFEQCPTIWNEYVNWIKDNYRYGYEYKIFEQIWNIDKWCECVGYAFKVLVDDDKVFFVKGPVNALFAKTPNDTVMKRKKHWLLEKLYESSSDVEKCRKLIDVVATVLPDWKLEFILNFLKENKNVEDFKKIHLFPSFCSWTGSEVPLILSKIDFVKSLKDRLKGVDYIDHRDYLEEKRRSLKKYQEQVELKEYLENVDYA